MHTYVLHNCMYKIQGFLEKRWFEFLEKGKPEVEFKEFEPRLIFKPWLKYGWSCLKLYSVFQDLSRRSIETGFGGIWDAA